MKPRFGWRGDALISVCKAKWSLCLEETWDAISCAVGAWDCFLLGGKCCFQSTREGRTLLFTDGRSRTSAGVWTGKTGVAVQQEMGSCSSAEGIPSGKGPYAVGCTDLMADHTIKGSFLRLYYPCWRDGAHEDLLWIPRKEYYYGLADFLKINRRIAAWLFGRLFGSVTCPANWNVPFRTGEKYPLIIFSHGLGAFRTLYSAICIELTSQGFVVAAVEHRDESASATYYFKDKENSDAQQQNSTTITSPFLESLEKWIYYRRLKPLEHEFPLRHQQVQQRADECIEALNLITDINSGKQVKNSLPLEFDWTTLKDCIDLCKVAIMGHSFGGATVVQSLSKDTRFRCGVALDSWMFPLGDEVYSKVIQPLFFINSERFQWAGNIMKIKKLDCPVIQRKMITLLGTVHQSFPDFTFLTGSFIGRLFQLKGSIDPCISMDICNKASLAFLQKHLGSELRLTIPSKLWKRRKKHFLLF
nr:PREDICTED: platelet-activating factor acetylhydrolase isoform X2 [Latimeria chalumnae]|eukprot:XP_014348591.1 PREDICTED: platelet-activating factor acetylhydrolase isoform X2 [Latimeria chalumnae]